MTDSTSLYYYGNSGGSLAVPTLQHPLSMFFRLLSPAVSDLPIGDVLQTKHKGICLWLFTIKMAYKDGNSSRMVAALRMSHSPDGVTVTPPSLYLYANYGGL